MNPAAALTTALQTGRIAIGLGAVVDAVDLASAAAAKEHIPGAAQTMAIAGRRARGCCDPRPDQRRA